MLQHQKHTYLDQIKDMNQQINFFNLNIINITLQIPVSLIYNDKRSYTIGISLIETDPPQADRLIRLYIFL